MTTLDPAYCADGCGRLAETERPTADGRREQTCREHATPLGGPVRTMTDPRCGKVSRANDTDGHCTRCHRTWAGESAFTAHQHISDGVLSCEDPETATKPNGERKWWPRERPGTTDGVAWGLGEPGWAGLRGTVVPVEAGTASPDDACWCGGEVGPRTPGDAEGLGCLADITHDWAWACRNCEDIDPGSHHTLDRFCLRDKCAPGCEFIAPHPEHPCGRYPSGERSSNPREDG